jgi:hypothetical protein
MQGVAKSEQGEEGQRSSIMVLGARILLYGLVSKGGDCREAFFIM